MNNVLTRRHFLQNLGFSASALAFFPNVLKAQSNNQFNPLNIPPLQEGTVINGVKHFELTPQQGTSQFFKGYDTKTWGYNGAFLGPTLRAKAGDHVNIKVINQLNDITTVHWHGMVLPAKMDGGPHQEIKPNGVWQSNYKINQPAATLFYHSHTHGKTGEQVYKGLGGMFILEDDESLQKGIPSDYGVDDIPVVMQDRDFNEVGQFNYVRFRPEQMIGKHGAHLLVNGTHSPLFKAQKSLLRLRLLNASNARFYHLRFNDNRPFQVIASDGGFLEKPLTVTQLPMSPAERYEILVDVSDRKQIMLQSVAGLGNADHGPMRMMGMNKDFDVLFIDASNALKSEHKAPKELTQYADWSKVTIAAERNFDLQMGMGGGMMSGNRGDHGGGIGAGMMRINNQSFSMSRIDERLKTNTYEIWNISNDSPMVHPFHVHNTQFRVISRNGEAPLAHEMGYKDTVIINQRDTVKILMPTGPYSDSDIPYMYHCHILEHEDAGMMGQFTVET